MGNDQMTQNHDKQMLRRAKAASFWSKDPSTRIGAVVHCAGQVLGRGHNGFPPGIAEDERMNDREQKYELVVHAEMRALISAGRAAHGGTLYLWGFKGPPCTNCTKHLIEAGIRRVVASGTPTPERWAESLRKSEAMLAEAGILFETYDPEEIDR